jgi:hypothetical protein
MWDNVAGSAGTGMTKEESKDEAELEGKREKIKI